jgi:hypothetical protein
MISTRVHRKGREMEKVENLYRTAAAEDVLLTPRDN